MIEREIEDIILQDWAKGYINHELLLQDGKWGAQRHSPSDWLAILVEEVGELAQAVLKETFPLDEEDHGDHSIEHELIQVAAVAIQWLQTRKDEMEQCRGAQRREKPSAS